MWFVDNVTLIFAVSGGAVVTNSPPISEFSGSNLKTYVGKLVVSSNGK